MKNGIFLGTDSDNKRQHLLLPLANRHGLIAGATGTGKTVTLQILCEGLSKAGVPVFAADVKGDLSGISQSGSVAHKLHDKLLQRAMNIGLSEYDYAAMPTVFWDLYGKQGHPVRTTIAEMGPTLLARLMGLNETQEGILTIAFELADDEAMLLLDMKDLRALLNYISDNKAEISRQYGNVTSQSVAAIQRKLLKLERAGADEFFAEPALDLHDFMKVDENGHGMVNILAANELINTPDLYSTFLLWLLSELFEELPEVGNPDKPKMVFFFDEAHLLFDGAPKPLVDKVEQVARLIRSKGVGIYFVTQNPQDIPEDVLSQLGNRVQHALRAFTARDRRRLVMAAETYRENPRFSTEEAIREVGVGEAVTSMLMKKGIPGIVERTLIRPPSSHLGPIPKDARQQVIDTSHIAGKYEAKTDRHSAYEILMARADQAAKEAAAAEEKEEEMEIAAREYKAARRYSGTRVTRSTSRGRAKSDSFGSALGQAVIKELKGTTGRRIVRGILGGLFKAR